MDYFRDAFGSFNPRTDKDAALKICLDVILADRRFPELDNLLPDETEVGGMEGEPGWIIERRNEGEIEGYENWPAFARFHAFVEPNSYALAYPDFFCDKSTFEKFVSSAMRAYCNRHPERSKDIESILQKIG